MAAGGWRRYDVQARYAIVLATVSVVPLIGAVGLALRNYEHDLGKIVYGTKGLFLPAFLGCIVLSGVPAAAAFALGLNSSDQRRNDTPGRSWAAFFIGGLVGTIDVILLIAFWMLRMAYGG